MSTPFSLSSVQRECHQTSRSKGWWDNCAHAESIRIPSEDQTSDHAESHLDPALVLADLGTKLCLIHSELDEAHEEYDLDLAPTTYFVVGGRKLLTDSPDRHLAEGAKPEGYFVELGDAVIRVFDLMGALGARDWREYAAAEAVGTTAATRPGADVDRDLNMLHRRVSRVLEAFRDHASLHVLCERLAQFVQYVDLTLAGDDAEQFAEAVRLKLAYNKTRPFKHGGKRV